MPPHYHTLDSQPSSRPAAAPPQPPAEENDLIDFGQNDTYRSAQPLIPVGVNTGVIQNGGRQQKDMEKILQASSTAQGNQGQGSLLDFHEDMNHNLPSAEPLYALKRRDMDTQSLDEFVDAEG